MAPYEHLISKATVGKTITCKAAVAWKPKAELVVQDIQVAPPQAGKVRIRITHTSLCQSDVTFWKLEGADHLFPRIFGHEAAGIVESVGDGVMDLRAGDHVIPLFKGECRQCKYCKSAKTNYCEKFLVTGYTMGMKRDGTSRFSVDGGRQPIHRFLSSTFSEYTVLEHEHVVKINPDAPLDKVVVLACGLPTGMGAVWNSAKVEAGEVVAIFGLGTIGLAVAEGAKVANASRIIGVDINPKKFERGKTFGITDFVNPNDCNEPVQEVLKRMTNGGVDHAFEYSGQITAMLSAIESCDPAWGKTTILGVVEKEETIPLSPYHVLDGRIVKGSTFGGFKGSDLAELVNKYLRKEFLVDQFITHNISFKNINEAFELLKTGQSLRCVMHLV